MKLFRRQRPAPAPRRRTPLEVLLEELDAISDPNYQTAAARIASDVRSVGAKAARVHLADAAPFVAESFGALVHLNPILGALAAYGRTELGVDIARIPAADVRRRMAADRHQEARLVAGQRADAAMAEARSRRVLRQFAELRSYQR